MIRNRRFFDFVNELVSAHQKEEEDKAFWECWLHKEFEKSFSDFVSDLKETEKQRSMSQAQMSSIVAESASILNDFVPDE